MNNHYFMPNDEVISCRMIESGIRFMVEGIACCCANTWGSPILITAEELKNNKFTYDLMIKRREELFYALNNKIDKDAGACSKCGLTYTTKFKNIDFSKLGGHKYPSGFNISHFSKCNLRCSYCLYTKENNFCDPIYKNIIPIIEEFRSRNKLLSVPWIEYNGGEPTILPEFEEILAYLIDNKVGPVCVFSNAVIYRQELCNRLQNNSCYLTTSLDAGIPSTFTKIRGANCFEKVIDHLIQYKLSGTNNLFLKYIICDNNRTEDDLYAFVFLMCLIHPAQVYICPDFPYDDRSIPDETVHFGAKMWYLLKKYGGITPYIQSDDMKGDPIFKKFSEDIRAEYALLCEKNPITDIYNIRSINDYKIKDKYMQNIDEQNTVLTSKFYSMIECACINAFKKYKKYNFIFTIALKISPRLYEYLYIKSSSLFNSVYYLECYPDIKLNGKDPLMHYIKYGYKEGRNPTPWFNTANYYSFNPDTKGINPFYHYLRYGYKEKRII